MKLIVIIWLAFIIVSSCLFDGTSGHGSHQHMGKHHDHYVPKVDRGAVHSVLDEKKLIQDTDHLKEDLKDVYTEEQIKKMSPEELDFHYFKLHDYDNNDRLDGLEVMAAIAHVVPTDPDLDLSKPGEEYVLTEEQKQKLIVARAAHEEQHKHFISMIDQMFKDNDLDKDGFINYREFVRTRRPDAMYRKL